MKTLTVMFALLLATASFALAREGRFERGEGVTTNTLAFADLERAAHRARVEHGLAAEKQRAEAARQIIAQADLEHGLPPAGGQNAAAARKAVAVVMRDILAFADQEAKLQRQKLEVNVARQ